VKLGLRNDTDSEVLNGLNEGDVVGVPPTPGNTSANVRFAGPGGG
jgi:hypothetical protein